MSKKKSKEKSSKKLKGKSTSKKSGKAGKRSAGLSSKETFLPDINQKLYGELAIEENELERFPNRTTVRRYTIEFTCPEFTCLCPRSGFPDFATIRIKYVPDEFCVELKSLKLYINGFRNKKVFHEDVTNNIIQDLIDLLDPHEIEVIGDFTVRGNVHTVVTAKHSKKSK
jgi:7-cyano-7-deazaguanine reductase